MSFHGLGKLVERELRALCIQCVFTILFYTCGEASERGKINKIFEFNGCSLGEIVRN